MCVCVCFVVFIIAMVTVHLKEIAVYCFWWQLEDKIRALQFPHTTIFKPGLLNRGSTDRVFEKIACKWQTLCQLRFGGT